MSARSSRRAEPTGVSWLRRVIGGAILASFAFALVGCRRDASEQASPGAKESAASDPIRVAAASDLTTAFEALAKSFETDRKVKVKFSFGSTGLLSKQIQEGAPYDVFAGANIRFVDDTAKSGACIEASKALYARGRIVIWSKDDSAKNVDIRTLDRRDFKKIAIANPDHAPYGTAAREALMSANVWKGVEQRLVYGENVRQSLQFAESGNSELAIVALSLAIVAGGTYSLIDENLHKPLDQALIVCRGGKRSGPPRPEATAFAEYVSSKAGRAIMKKYGFLLPGEAMSQQESSPSTH